MRMLLALRLVKTSVGLVGMFYGQFHKSKEQNIFTNLLKVVFFFSPSLFTLICLPPDKRAACQGEGRMEGNGRETSSRTEQGNVTAYILVASHLMAIVLIVF